MYDFSTLSQYRASGVRKEENEKDKPFCKADYIKYIMSDDCPSYLRYLDCVESSMSKRPKCDAFSWLTRPAEPEA